MKLLERCLNDEAQQPIEFAKSEPHKAPSVKPAILEQEARIGWKEYLCVVIGSMMGYVLAVLT